MFDALPRDELAERPDDPAGQAVLGDIARLACHAVNRDWRAKRRFDDVARLREGRFVTARQRRLERVGHAHRACFQLEVFEVVQHRALEASRIEGCADVVQAA